MTYRLHSTSIPTKTIKVSRTVYDYAAKVLIASAHREAYFAFKAAENDQSCARVATMQYDKCLRRIFDSSPFTGIERIKLTSLLGN